MASVTNATTDAFFAAGFFMTLFPFLVFSLVFTFLVFGLVSTLCFDVSLRFASCVGGGAGALGFVFLVLCWDACSTREVLRQTSPQLRLDPKKAKVHRELLPHVLGSRQREVMYSKHTPQHDDMLTTDP